MRHLLTAVCCLTGLLASQQEVRVRIRGTVVDKHGQAWAGARVFLHGREVPGFDSIGTADAIEVTSDQRGRFVARILTDRSYHVWAAASSGDDTYRASAPVARVVPGRPVALVEQDVVFSRVRFRITGEHTGKLSMKITNDAGLSHTSLALVGNPTGSPVVLDLPLHESRGEMPMLPWQVCRVELFDDGRWVHADNVTLAKPRRAVWAGPPASGPFVINPGLPSAERIVSMTENVLEILKPKLVRYQIRGHDGKKLPGAGAWLLLRGKLYPLATADDSGLVKIPGIASLSLQYRWALDLLGPQLTFTAPGHAAAVQGSALHLTLPSDEADRLHTIRLVEGHELTGRLLVAGKPLARAPLIVSRTAYGDDGSLPLVTEGFVLPVISQTDADGRFAVEYCGKGLVSVAALLPVSLARDLGGTGRVARKAIVAARKLSKETDWTLGEIEITKLRRVRVHVRRPDGARLRNPRVVVFPPENRMSFGARLADVVADRRGDTTVVLATDGKLGCIVAGDDGYGIHTIEPTSAEVELVARPALTVSGRVVDAVGKPIAGVTVTTQPDRRAFGMGDAALLTLRDRFVQETDALGRFKIWMLSDSGEVVLSMDQRGVAPRYAVRKVEVGRKSVEGVELKFERPKPAARTGDKKRKDGR